MFISSSADSTNKFTFTQVAKWIVSIMFPLISAAAALFHQAQLWSTEEDMWHLKNICVTSYFQKEYD